MTPPAPRRQLYDFGPGPSVPSPMPSSIRLDDGTLLAKLTPVAPRQLGIGNWVLIDGRPHRIHDLRWRQGDGRIIHFDDRPPYPVTPLDTVHRYDLVNPAR